MAANLRSPDGLALLGAIVVALWGNIALLGPAKPLGIPGQGLGGLVLGGLLAGTAAVRLLRPADRSSARLAVVIVVAGMLAIVAGLSNFGAHRLEIGSKPVALPVAGAGLLVIGVTIAAGGVGGLASIRLRHASLPLLILLVTIAATWLVADLSIWSGTSRFYDFKVYRAAGVHANAGAPVWLPYVLTQLPSSVAEDWFLYPPPLVPLLRLVALLPEALAAWSFAVAMAACGVLAYRALGLRWRWALLLLAFPPMMKGIASGNIANLTFLLFAAGFTYGPGLVLGVLLKVQAVIPGAWLVRERRWRDLAAGIGIVVIVCLVTLPWTGIDAWRAWLTGLAFRAQSQENLPILYGNSIARYLPTAAFVAVTAAATAAALALPGRRGLASLGLASIVGSPTLWLHGLVVAIPAVLALPSAAAVWTAIGIGGLSAGSGQAANLALWTMAGLGVVGIVFGRWRGDRDPGPLDPLGPGRSPWPELPRQAPSASASTTQIAPTPGN